VPDRFYVPRFNVMPGGQDGARAFVAAIGTAQLVTVDADGVPDATFLPVLWQDDRLIGHVARANPHWRAIVDGSSALAVVTGPDAYVSPSSYATKREHGRVVPTWNYSAVHLRGRVRSVHDPAFLRAVVTALTEHHESGRQEPWAVTDAPEVYVDKQLRAIVGIELLVESVEAKAKLSQNRSEEDRAGVVADLDGTPGQAVADAMRDLERGP
jgi:transcriptional regulator